MNVDIFNVLTSFKLTSAKYRISDDDWADRLNHLYTSLFLIVVAIVISAKVYIVGSPIQCWVPAHFTEAWEQYTENYCWVENTYFEHPHKPLSSDPVVRRHTELIYYQWVPFVLALQALMFYIPCIFWRAINQPSGTDLKSLVELATDAISLSPGKYVSQTPDQDADQIRLSNVMLLVHHIKMAVKDTKNRLSQRYLMVKLLYIVNIIGQFFLIQAFIGTTYSFFGIEILRDLAQGREWRHSSHFPRVTLCDFTIRTLANAQNHTVQCVLVINLVNEKVYIAIWLWLFVLAIVTLAQTLSWITWSFSANRRVKSVRRYLICGGIQHDEGMFDNFVNEFLQKDGSFVLRLLRSNANESIVSDAVIELWRDYKKHQEPPSRQPLNVSPQIRAPVDRDTIPMVEKPGRSEKPAIDT